MSKHIRCIYICTVWQSICSVYNQCSIYWLLQYFSVNYSIWSDMVTVEPESEMCLKWWDITMKSWRDFLFFFFFSVQSLWDLLLHKDILFFKHLFFSQYTTPQHRYTHYLRSWSNAVLPAEPLDCTCMKKWVRGSAGVWMLFWYCYTYGDL